MQLEQPPGREDLVDLIDALTHITVSCRGTSKCSGDLTSVIKKTGGVGFLEGTKMEKHSELITSFST